MHLRARWAVLLVGLALGVAVAGEPAPRFTVATYNLENYVDVVTSGRVLKPADAKARSGRSCFRSGRDVLAVQEIGRESALLELRAALKADGLEFPHWEHVTGFDTNIFVGVLSRFPIVARRPHTNENFLLQGRRFQVSRGFAEVDIQVTPRYAFTLFTTHLKSRRVVEYGDEASGASRRP